MGQASDRPIPSSILIIISTTDWVQILTVQGLLTRGIPLFVHVDRERQLLLKPLGCRWVMVERSQRIIDVQPERVGFGRSLRVRKARARPFARDLTKSHFAFFCCIHV